MNGCLIHRIYAVNYTLGRITCKLVGTLSHGLLAWVFRCLVGFATSGEPAWRPLGFGVSWRHYSLQLHVPPQDSGSLRQWQWIPLYLIRSLSYLIHRRCCLHPGSYFRPLLLFSASGTPAFGFLNSLRAM